MSYTVNVTREDGQWLADVPDVPGAHTYARSLTALNKAVREVIVLMDDLDEADMPALSLDFDYRIDDPAIQRAARLGDVRRDMEASLADTPDAVADLLAEGYSIRDVSELLHVTPGRVSQISMSHRERLEE